MANAQILIVVRGSNPAALQAAVSAAGRAAGFNPGPSTSAAGTSTVIRQGITGVFTDGPWLGFEFDGASLPTVPSRVDWSAVRMNLLDGPDRGEDVVADALRPTPGLLRLASRSPRNAISWDRGVPAPIPLTEGASPAASYGPGLLIGVAAVAALAFAVSRATASPPPREPRRYGSQGRPMTIRGLRSPLGWGRAQKLSDGRFVWQLTKAELREKRKTTRGADRWAIEAELSKRGPAKARA